MCRWGSTRGEEDLLCTWRPDWGVSCTRLRTGACSSSDGLWGTKRRTWIHADSRWSRRKAQSRHDPQTGLTLETILLSKELAKTGDEPHDGTKHSQTHSSKRVMGFIFQDSSSSSKNILVFILFFSSCGIKFSRISCLKEKQFRGDAWSQISYKWMKSHMVNLKSKQKRNFPSSELTCRRVLSQKWRHPRMHHK